MTYYLHCVNQEWGLYSEISDQGLVEYIMAEVWDFPVMTERTSLKVIYDMAFSLWTWACDKLKQTTGQHITLKK